MVSVPICSARNITKWSSRPNRIVTQSQGTPRQSPWSHEIRVSYYYQQTVHSLLVSSRSHRSRVSYYCQHCIVLLLVPSIPWKSGLPPLPLHWHLAVAGQVVHHLSTWTGATYRGYLVEHKTCDILAAERLRLMRFDNRLIIDSFQVAICLLKR